MVAKVFVRGFDFGTKEEQIEVHCSTVGPVKSLEKWGNGAAVVEYETDELAEAAVAQLNKTIIEGNTRFIDVKLDLKSKDTPPPPKAVTVKREAPVVTTPSPKVFVRGFDFGTTDEQLEAHMSAVGKLETVKWTTKGSALVTYGSVEEAQAAVDQLNNTTIEGNTRFIDVIMKDAEDAPKRPKVAAGQWVFVPNGAPGVMVMGKKKNKGNKGNRKEDPAGSGRVFVRGFEFNTTDEQLLAHMAPSGEVEKVHWISKGSAIVVYKEAAAAKQASVDLHQSIIAGQTRYVDVILKDSE
eukprot:gb/GFBE01082624.1/.p1 GENE.gb/GFBE01082624.1/~~gb/GFBE01082624.1/.p1  ORF type:complete len:296 (+),score=108.63 gb/GFBE01082624.1/:1-888(+)